LSNVGDLVCDVVFAEDVAVDDTSLFGLDNVAHTLGEDGVAIVDAAISGEEADKTLGTMLVVVIP
jgi:3-hydroxyisobutyrate dehydrogenase-like beta-hydroxyacid dehydrogenase